jgi:secreted trypsin-like serine protease
VSEDTVLKISCNENYILDGCTIVACLNGKWTPDIGKCQRTCPSIYSTATMTVKCTVKNKEMVNCTDALDGTIAQFKCASYYEDSRVSRPKAICIDGRWSESVPDCRPVCGKVRPKRDPTLIVGGKVAGKRYFPWQAALYDARNEKFLCGGSLLNERIILTAAHCITDNDGNLLPKEFYVVAVGKHFRKYSDSRDSAHTQSSQIHRMFVPDEYEGDTQNYLADIAILVAVKTFTLSARIQPVCIDWTRNYEHAILNPRGGRKGFVAGWGNTVETGKVSDVLRQLRVPSVPQQTCKDDLPVDYRQYLTHDKLCAGYLNNGSSVCNGDSGGGLVFKYSDRFFVAGVVSLAPVAETTEGGCDSQQYGLYTVVYKYSDNFILRYLVRFKPSHKEDCKDCTTFNVTERPPPIATSKRPGGGNAHTEPPMPPNKGCVLPAHPDSGRWIPVGNSSKSLSPGGRVDHLIILKIECNNGHILDGAMFFLCNGSEWVNKMGKCLKTCPSINNTSTRSVTYEHKTTHMGNSIPIDGTIARFTCAPFYEKDSVKQRPFVCLDGTWAESAPKCVPVSGQKAREQNQLIIGGSSLKRGLFPWHVAIYMNKDVIICGGSLLSERVILTAAQCVTHSDGQVRPKENYTIAVGKFYSKIWDRRDIDETQFSKIEEIFVAAEYRGRTQNNFADIAIIVTDRAFKLSRAVQPVAVDWAKAHVDKVLRPDKQQFGYISGWNDFAQHENYSTSLSTIKVPFINHTTCSLDVPESYEHYLTSDKICTTFGKGDSICMGDRGAGLVAEYNEKYYIFGVLSFSPPSGIGKCDTSEYGLYTRVESYIDDFILEKVARYNTV